MRKIFTCMMLAFLGSILSLARAADVLPEAGKTYFIKSDNVNTNKEDEDYFLYSDNGTLKLSVNRGGENFLWVCEKEGENYRFKNKTGKYLAFPSGNSDRTSISLTDTYWNFKIDPTQKVNAGCLPLFSVTADRYMLVKNGGTAFNQANRKYDKASSTDAYSSDYIFEEFTENSKLLIIQTDQPGTGTTFSWNGETYTDACSFLYDGVSSIQNATLTAKENEDPASPYEFIGFFEGDQELGKTVNISSLSGNRTLTAKHNLNIFSSTYGEKWLRVIWNSNKTYAMGLPESDSYTDVAPKTIVSDMGTEAQLWCFVGTAESFKIYNKAAGETLALATASTNYADGTATSMKPEANATSWHLVNNNGWNISPEENTLWGLNSYSGAGNALKLYNNGKAGNIWNFEKSSGNALTVQVLVNGEPKALNTNVGQVSISLGTINKTINVTSTPAGPQKYYLANNVNLNFKPGSTQYRGYKFKGFQINDGELQPVIENLPFDAASLQSITAVYEVDTEDPSQYLFYTPGKEGHPYRIPAITTLNNGNILAVSDFRWDGADIGMGAVDLVGRISEDNGATWGEQFNIAVGTRINGDKARGYGDAAIVTDRESGKVLIMCCTGSVFYSSGTRDNPLRSARLYSDDNGEHWTTPEDITEQMYALLPNSKGQFIGAGKICQSRVTKVGDYYRLYAALCTRPDGNYVIYSDDFGKTWAVLGGNETSCAPSGDEPKCEELPDGSVVLSSRKYSGRYFNIYKYTDVTTAAGSWLGVVSSNDTDGGLKVNWNSTNGEIQLAKVIKKADNSFHYMMIQSLPYGKINSGDAERSNVCIFYKVFDDYTMNSSTDIATGWTRGMVFENAKGAYSTMCIQPDKNLGFFYEEGPNDYCMVYRPVSIEQLTNDAYTMYDESIYGPVDELQRAVEVEKAKVKAVLDEYANKHNDNPGLGECTNATYQALQNAYDGANKDNYLQLGDAINTLKENCNWPIFTIDNKYTGYAGKSIYDDNSGSLHIKKTDTEDQQMWWKFQGLASTTMEYGDYVVTNPSSGRLFWDAEFLSFSATDPETEGCFIIKTNGSGSPLHVQSDGLVIRWDTYGPNSASSWGVTYVGNSFDLELPSVKGFFTTTLTAAKEYVIGSTLGTYTDAGGSFTAALQAAEEAQEIGLDQLGITEIRTLANNLNDAMSQLSLNMPEAGKFYRFKSKSSGKYISSNAAVGSKPAMIEDGTDQSSVFYLSADNHLTGNAALNIAGDGKFANNLGDMFTFTASPFKGYYVIRKLNHQNKVGAFYDYSSSNGKLDTWSDSNAELCAWEIIEVSDEAQQPKLTRTIAADSYATMAAPVALNIPQGVQAYTVTVSEDKTQAILEEVTDVIPAGTAVVLKNAGEEANFSFTFAPEGSTENENSLTGVYVDTAIPTATNAYILGNKDNQIGFYQMSTDDRTLAAHKAYLTLPAEASAIRSIIFSDGTTTGIENTVAEGAENEEYYDLQGRRVMNPTKGIYITKSGKKVIFNH